MPKVLNISKTERQVEFAKKWIRSKDHGATKNGSGTFWAVTGFGKTFGTIQQVIKPYIRKEDKHREVIILTCRDEHFKHWNKALDDHIPDVNYRKLVKVFTVQTLLRTGITYFADLLIVDELHKFYGEEFGKYIDGTKIKFIHNLGLTATFIDKRQRHKQYVEQWLPIDRITQADALKEGWISRFIEYNLAVDLTKEEVEIYTSLQEDINRYLSKFGRNGYSLAFACHRGRKEGGQFYNANIYARQYAESHGWFESMPKDNPIHRQWNPGVIRGYAKMLIEATRMRSDLLYFNDSKFEATMNLIDTFKGLKTMTFGQSTKFADKIAKEYNLKGYGYGVVFHTQLKSRPLTDEHGEYILYKSGNNAGKPRIFGKTALKKQAMQAFMSNKANLLATASALDENFDCPDIELGINTARTSNPNQQIQRGGRIKRLLPKDSDAIMLIVNIYNKHTKDYDWLRSAQSTSEHYIKWVSTVDDINFLMEDQDVYDISDI